MLVTALPHQQWPVSQEPRTPYRRHMARHVSREIFHAREKIAKLRDQGDPDVAT